MTAQRVAQFAAILTTALALIPGAAHALELRNKMRFSRFDYLVVQRIYRGWEFVGVCVVAALLSTAVLAWLTKDPLAWLASGLIIGTQIIFWTLTFPVNRRTRNWTRVSDDWAAFRRQWEFSHALSMLMNFAAFICTIFAVIDPN